MATPARFPKRIEGGTRLRKFQGLGVPIVPSERDEGVHAVLMKKHAADAITIGEEGTMGVRGALAAAMRSEGLFTGQIAEILDLAPPPPACTDCGGEVLEYFDASLLGGIKRITEIAMFVNGLRRKYARQFSEAVARFRVTQIERDIDATNERRWKANIITTAKADPKVPDKMGRILVRRDPQPGDAVKNKWAQRNLDLLKTDIDDPRIARGRIVTVPDFYFDKYERILTDGRRADRNVEDIVKDLQNLTGQTIRRSDALARDQVSSHNTALERLRSTDAGITHFLWVTRRDQRVRDLHSSRDSKLFAYAHRFSDGPPGVPPRCRCRSQPSLRRSRADPEDFRELIPVSSPGRKPGETPIEFLKKTRFSAPIPLSSNRPALIPRLVGGNIVFGDPLEGTQLPRARLRKQ